MDGGQTAQSGERESRERLRDLAEDALSRAFVWAGFRVGYIFVSKLVDAAISIHLNCFHKLKSSFPELVRVAASRTFAGFRA